MQVNLKIHWLDYAHCNCCYRHYVGETVQGHLNGEHYPRETSLM